MAHHSLLFDSDAADNPAAKRSFRVADGHAHRILVAGLADGESVPIYVRVGSPSGTRAIGGSACGDGGPDGDWLWAPLSRCGVPVVLTPESMEHIERIPGLYMVGDPAAEPAFAGDVNISHDQLDKMYLFVDPYCGAGGDLLDESLCTPATPLGVLSSW